MASFVTAEDVRLKTDAEVRGVNKTALRRASTDTDIELRIKEHEA